MFLRGITLNFYQYLKQGVFETSEMFQFGAWGVWGLVYIPGSIQLSPKGYGVQRYRV